MGWDVIYGVIFVPTVEDEYPLIFKKKKKKVILADATVIRDSFVIGEPGKVVLTIDNMTSKLITLLYDKALFQLKSEAFNLSKNSIT
ncbi:patellin-1-like [Durio zibethinus]|uniref:Patellin-1-like n=1 Tax=Durio zibethinus TaxID=66656 RepID=A0A6P6B5P7_DURZI|nr:patellin-1-like [Durio zibethinus]